MTRPVRALVTAVGGDLGQALVKALRLSTQPVECLGCDMDSQSAGRVFVDEFRAVPPATETEDYLAALDKICRTLEVDAILPASEPEIEVLSRAKPLSSGSVIVCQRPNWLDTFGDKLTCMTALRGQVDLVPFADGADRPQVENLVAESGFPVVVKSRRSSGSRSFRIAHTERELGSAVAETESPIVQAHIDAAFGEFSIGVFVCESFEAIIGFRREIGPGGSSWTAETVDDQQVLEYVRQVSHAAQVRGAVNVQVRKSLTGVRLLEINPRFSSLAAARALCGFRDVEWSLELAMGREPARPTAPFKAIRFRRFLHEVVDFGEGAGALPAWAPRSVATATKDAN